MICNGKHPLCCAPSSRRCGHGVTCRSAAEHESEGGSGASGCAIGNAEGARDQALDVSEEVKLVVPGQVQSIVPFHSVEHSAAFLHHMEALTTTTRSEGALVDEVANLQVPKGCGNVSGALVDEVARLRSGGRD